MNLKFSKAARSRHLIAKHLRVTDFNLLKPTLAFGVGGVQLRQQQASELEDFWKIPIIHPGLRSAAGYGGREVPDGSFVFFDYRRIARIRGREIRAKLSNRM
jgi:hypothetical protein